MIQKQVRLEVTALRSSSLFVNGSAALLIFVFAFKGQSEVAKKSARIPYDATNPIIYDNDSSEDMYTDEFVMALSNSKKIDLRGIVTTEGGWRDSWDSSDLIARHAESARRELVAKARRSGMSGIPDPVSGPGEPLLMPPSGKIADTKPFRSDAAHLIVTEALGASPEKPLLVVVGGPVTSIADAFLTSPEITNRVIIAWNGSRNWNGEAKPFRWATEIVLRNFTCVLFAGVAPSSAPDVPAARLLRLPENELTRYMRIKKLPHVNLPNHRDGDAPPVIPLVAPDYVESVVRYRWIGRTRAGRPVLRRDRFGNLWRVTRASSQIATDVWWAIMGNSQSWNGSHPPIATPYGGRPATIPGRIQIECFDNGGPGIAYFDTDPKSWSQSRVRDITAFRVLEQVDFSRTNDAADGFAVVNAVKSEWLSYTTDTAVPGPVSISLRLQAIKRQSAFQIDIDGRSVSPAVVLKNRTSGWETVHVGSVHLKRGLHIIRLSIVRGEFAFDWMQFSPN